MKVVVAEKVEELLFLLFQDKRKLKVTRSRKLSESKHCHECSFLRPTAIHIKIKERLELWQMESDPRVSVALAANGSGRAVIALDVILSRAQRSRRISAVSLELLFLLFQDKRKIKQYFPKTTTMGAKKTSAALIPKLNIIAATGKGYKYKYHEEFPIHAFKLCLLGATNKMLAAYFNVTARTIQNWQKNYPEFDQATVRGKRAADMEVAHSLYQSTLDRIITLRQAIKCKEVFYDEKGKRVEKERVEMVTVEKHVPADFRAQQFWLRNRAPEHWAFKHDDAEEARPVVTIDLGTGHNPGYDEITE